MDRAILESLLADLPGALIISTSILVLFATAEAIKRLRDTPTEWTRKLTHVGGGVIVFGVPWLLQSAWTVALLSLAFAGILIGGKVTGLLSSVHDVERKTSGAYYYPFAVLGLYLLAEGDWLLYCAPLAVMAVADTGAALVGKHRGQVRYRVLDGDRSLEGSFTFFGLAFVLILVGLALAGRPGWPEMLLVTLVVATLTTAVEAVSVRGSDNLLIPYIAWLALDRTLALGLEGLGPWIEGMLVSLVLLLVTARRADLTVAGSVTLFLIGSLAWALGGQAWWWPPTAVYLLFLLARLPRVDTDLDRPHRQFVDELVDVLVARRPDMGCGAVPNDPSVMNHGDPIGNSFHRVDIARNRNGRRSDGRYAVTDKAADLVCHDGIKPGGGLIQKQYFRVARNGPSKTDPLLHAAGKLTGVKIADIGSESHNFQLFRRDPPRFGSRHSVKIDAQKTDILPDPQ